MSSGPEETASQGKGRLALGLAQLWHSSGAVQVALVPLASGDSSPPAPLVVYVNSLCPVNLHSSRGQHKRLESLVSRCTTGARTRQTGRRSATCWSCNLFSSSYVLLVSSSITSRFQFHWPGLPAESLIGLVQCLPEWPRLWFGSSLCHGPTTTTASHSNGSSLQPEKRVRASRKSSSPTRPIGRIPPLAAADEHDDQRRRAQLAFLWLVRSLSRLTLGHSDWLLRRANLAQDALSNPENRINRVLMFSLASWRRLFGWAPERAPETN